MKYSFYIGLLLLLVSCSSSENEEVAPTKAAIQIEQPANGTSVNDKGEKKEELQYFPNGQIRIFGKYEKGKRTGLWSAFFEDGKKNSETEYVDGEKHGKSLVWYSHGELFYQGYYENNEKVGVWKFYTREGKMEREINYNEEAK